MAAIDSKQDLQAPIAGTRKTQFKKFFSCNPNQDALFAINADIDLDDALEQASTFLSSAEKVVRDLAMMNGGNESAFAALYLVQMSKALVDASILSEAREGGAA
ncbi:MAG: DUF3077 domain-containing protein [Sulfuritalea sp.]|nr:DUF3077 domain-containing protein [Sulfuritalea sp.]